MDSCGRRRNLEFDGAYVFYLVPFAKAIVPRSGALGSDILEAVSDRLECTLRTAGWGGSGESVRGGTQFGRSRREKLSDSEFPRTIPNCVESEVPDKSREYSRRASPARIYAVSISVSFPIKAIMRNAECRQINRFQSFM